MLPLSITARLKVHQQVLGFLRIWAFAQSIDDLNQVGLTPDPLVAFVNDSICLQAFDQLVVIAMGISHGHDAVNV